MWIIRGLKKGVITTKFPSEDDKNIPLSLRPNNIEKCPLKKSQFSCLECGLCEVKEANQEIHIKRTLKFKNSIHIFVIDVGSCSACNREISLLKAPQYDIHRLGFFFTPTPKHADILLVLGSPTTKMIPVLKEAYDLMPDPKIVISIGACAHGAFGSSVNDYVPVDAMLSGCPPQPVDILKVLLMVTGRWKK